MSSVLRHRGAPLFVLLVALMPLFSDVSQLTRVQLVLIYAAVGFGLNIGLGYAGEFAVAQPVVLGVAAYTAAILNVTLGWSSLATLPCAVGAGVVVGFALSAPGFRLQGWYLAITTFFAAVVFPDVVQFFRGTTNGSEGLAGISPLPGLGLTLGSSPQQFEYVLGIVVLLWLAMYNIYRSTWGVVLRAVRDAPLAAESCGVSVVRVKAAVALVSSAPVAIAGWMFAHVSGVISPNSFGLNLTIVIIAAVILGGFGTVWGPVIGIVVVELVALWIGPFSSYNALLVGVTILVVAAVMPEGIIPGLSALLRRRFGHGRGVAIAGVDVACSIADQALPPVKRVGSDHRAGEVVYETAGVDKSFAGLRVLDGAGLSVRVGEVVGLVGPNGSGKTTLLNIITGYIKADNGSARLFGQEVLGRTSHSLSVRGIRRSFQIPQLVGELSVIDNVRLGLLGGRSQQIIVGMFRFPRYRRRAQRDTAQIIAFCGALGMEQAILRSRVDELPLGLRRVVEVARAIVSGPALVCLDEPAAGLAGQELAKLGQVIRMAARTGSGVLLVEHNLGFVREVCDVIVEIQDGQITPTVSVP